MIKNIIKKIFGVAAIVVFSLYIPLVWFSGIIAFIWLAILGEWSLLGVGIFFSIGGTTIIGITSSILTVFTFPALILDSTRYSWIVIPFTILNGIGKCAIVIVWCTMIIFLFDEFINNTNYIPTIIWMYVVATGVWHYIAYKEIDNDISVISASFTEVGVIITLIGYVGFDFGIKEAFITQIIIHSFAVLLVSMILIKELSAEKERRLYSDEF